jgi:hypothetical protein
MLLSDGDGLYLRKQTRDGASWTVPYHFAGRQHWLTLGNYPDMPLAQLFEKIRDTPSFGEDNLLAIKLLLALCVPKGELPGARWEEFEFDAQSPSGAVWHLPAARTKTGEGLGSAPDRARAIGADSSIRIPHGAGPRSGGAWRDLGTRACGRSPVA